VTVARDAEHASEAEVAALRRGAGAFLNRRDVLSVRGDDAEAYLQGQLSQDITTLAIGGTTDTLLLEPDGKLCALLRISRLDGLGYALDVEAGFGAKVEARLRKFLLRSKVQISHLEWRCVSLRGSAVDSAAAGLLTALSEAGVLVLPFEWNGWRGVDLLGTRDLVLNPTSGGVPEAVTPCGPEAVEACRIASGLPAMGSELTEKTIAAEAGLVERTVSFTKGCYTGQELVARLDARGSKVARRLVGVIGGADPAGPALSYGMTLHAGEEPDPDPDPAEPLAQVAADKVVGSVTSAAWSPELGAWVALAYLHRSVESPGPVRVRSGDGLGRSHPARVAPLPLV
jgi:folate-binding protein YgfZ